MTRYGLNFWSSFAALPNISIALFQSLLLEASTPCCANFVAGVSSFFACVDAAQKTNRRMKPIMTGAFFIFYQSILQKIRLSLEKWFAKKTHLLRRPLRRSLARRRSRLTHAPDLQRAPAGFVDLDQRAAQAHLARRHRKGNRHVGNKSAHDRFNRAAEDRVDRAAHAGVAKKGRATGKNLFIGRLHVRVCTNHS